MKRLRKVSGINNSSISGSYYYYEFHYFKDMTSYSRRPAMGVVKSAMLGLERREHLCQEQFTRKGQHDLVSVFELTLQF